MADQERMEREDSISSQDPHNKKVKKAKNRRPASILPLPGDAVAAAKNAIQGKRIRRADAPSGCAGMNEGIWTAVCEGIRRTEC